MVVINHHQANPLAFSVLEQPLPVVWRDPSQLVKHVVVIPLLLSVMPVVLLLPLVCASSVLPVSTALSLVLLHVLRVMLVHISHSSVRPTVLSVTLVVIQS